MALRKEQTRKLRCIAIDGEKNAVREIRVDGEVIGKVKVGDIVEVPISQAKILALRPYFEIVKETGETQVENNLKNKDIVDAEEVTNSPKTKKR